MTKINPEFKPRLAFVYSGLGGQWAQMGLELMATEPGFAKTLEEIDKIFQGLAGWSIIEAIGLESNVSQVDQTLVMQPCILAIQIALTRLFLDYGVEPEGIIGHSAGEVAAAWAAGSLTLEQAIGAIYQRSCIQNKASGQGRMLAVELNEIEASAYIQGLKVGVATINGPKMLTLAGDVQDLEGVAEKLELKGIFNRFVNVEVPYHSHFMEALEDEIMTKMASFQGRKSKRPLYSTVTVSQEDGTHLGAEYWSLYSVAICI